MSQFRRLHDSRHSGPRKGKAFRPVVLMIIFAAVCWGFWSNNERRVDMLVGQSLFSDETGTVPAEQKDELIQHLKAFKKDFGIPLEVHVRKSPPAVNQSDASRMYIDIVPSQGRAFLFLPPLVRRAVGQEFIRDMERSFAEDFTAGDWRISLVPAVLALRGKLAEVTR